MKLQEIVDAALACGAAKAAVIDGNQIVLSADFRRICEANQCGGYGKCWMCPPFIGPIEALMDQVRGYSRGVLYQTIFPLEDSYDIEGMFEAGAAHARISRALQRRIKPLMTEEFLHLSCGGCHLCDTCAKRSDEPCRFPEDALSSMEGYGIDVYNTAKDTGLKYTNGENTVTYFGIVLVAE